MKFLALEHESPDARPDDFAPLLKAEAIRIWELQQADVIRAAYFRADRPVAVLELECTSLDEACQILESLPLVETGLISFEVIPLKPYPGLSRLFADAES